VPLLGSEMAIPGHGSGHHPTPGGDGLLAQEHLPLAKGANFSEATFGMGDVRQTLSEPDFQALHGIEIAGHAGVDAIRARITVPLRSACRQLRNSSRQAARHEPERFSKA